jgi:hypothetical protein
MWPLCAKKKKVRSWVRLAVFLSAQMQQGKKDEDEGLHGAGKSTYGFLLGLLELFSQHLLMIYITVQAGQTRRLSSSLYKSSDSVRRGWKGEMKS